MPDAARNLGSDKSKSNMRSSTSPRLNVNPVPSMTSQFSGVSLVSTQTPAPMASNKASDRPSRPDGNTNRAAFVSTSSSASPDSQSRNLILWFSHLRML